MKDTPAPATIDEYIASCPKALRPTLTKLRATIRKAAPDATERITYRMPTFFYNGNLVHFAAHESHIGFYPTPTGVQAFAKQLKPYVTSKGAVQFPLSAPLPFDLITEMVKYRVAENATRGKGKPK